MTYKKQEWLPVVGYEGAYEVSRSGDVRKVGRGRELKGVVTKRGYRRVVLCDRGLERWFRVHRLVALAFLPNPSGKPHVNHVNGVKTDNRAENLEWVTPLENTQHAIDSGLFRKARSGTDCSWAVLSQADVVAIRSDTRTHREIAWAYRISRQSVQRIKARIDWKHVS